MKNNFQTLIVFLLSICFGFPGYSQSIDKKVATLFSPGTLVKMYDIVQNVTLSTDQQLKLAAEIQSSDSIVAANIIEGKSAKEIEKEQRTFLGKMYAILGRDVMTYTNNKAESFAQVVSKGEEKYMLQNYSSDSLLLERYKVIQRNKYRQLYQQFLLFGNIDQKGTDQIAKTTGRYDSSEFLIYSMLCNQKYLREFFHKAKTYNVALSDSIAARIAVVFNARAVKNAVVSPAENMLEVLQLVFPDTTLISYMYKDILSRQSANLTSAEKFNLVREYHISPDAYDSTINLIREKHYRESLIGLTYAGNSKLRDQLLKEAAKKFDTAFYLHLLANGSITSSSQFTIALKYRKLLDLRPTLVDTLTLHALYLHGMQDSLLMLDPFVKTDYKAYEATILNEILTEDQYTKLLTLKNRSQVMNDMKDDLDDMEKWGLAKVIDQGAVKKELIRYYTAKWNAYYRMANNKLKQEANLKVLKDNQPKSLKMLAAAKKLPAPVNDNINVNLKGQ